MLVHTYARVEGKVRTDAQEHAAPVLGAQIKVVLPHEARRDSDAIATAGTRVADCDSGVLATLENDHDPEARAEALIEGLDPVLAPYAFGRLHDRDALSCRQPGDKAVVVLRNLAEVTLGDRRHLPALVEEADDHRWLLHRLNNRVEQHTIEARVLKPDALAVVLDERVHGGPPYGWLRHSHRRSPARQPGDFKGRSPLPSSVPLSWARPGGRGTFYCGNRARTCALACPPLEQNHRPAQARYTCVCTNVLVDNKTPAVVLSSGSEWGDE